MGEFFKKDIAGKTLKPYQGLKRCGRKPKGTGSYIAGKTLKPYQGLKQYWTLQPYLRKKAGKTLKPYQGLKPLLD